MVLETVDEAVDCTRCREVVTRDGDAIVGVVVLNAC